MLSLPQRNISQSSSKGVKWLHYGTSWCTWRIKSLTQPIVVITPAVAYTYAHHFVHEAFKAAHWMGSVVNSLWGSWKEIGHYIKFSLANYWYMRVFNVILFSRNSKLFASVKSLYKPQVSFIHWQYNLFSEAKINNHGHSIQW